VLIPITVACALLRHHELRLLARLRAAFLPGILALTALAAIQVTGLSLAFPSGRRPTPGWSCSWDWLIFRAVARIRARSKETVIATRSYAQGKSIGRKRRSNLRAPG
jgi:hypothetical protein